MKTSKNCSEWEEVLFSTLTYPPKMGLSRCLVLGDDFYVVIARHTKCHLRIARGIESAENKHEHAIILTKKDEIERFNRRIATFDSKRAFQFHHLVEGFDSTRRQEAYQYALVKHESPFEPANEFICPGHYHRCRKGKCQNIPT